MSTLELTTAMNFITNLQIGPLESALLALGLTIICGRAIATDTNEWKITLAPIYTLTATIGFNWNAIILFFLTILFVMECFTVNTIVKALTGGTKQ